MSQSCPSPLKKNTKNKKEEINLEIEIKNSNPKISLKNKKKIFIYKIKKINKKKIRKRFKRNIFINWYST